MPPRILYAEDHDDTRTMISLLLRRAGYDVAEAASAAEALEMAASSRFDLYLLDHAFPDSSGVELCRRLRAAHPGAPILFYTGRAMAAEREEAMRAGAQEYMVKPHDTFNIIGQVDKWLRRASGES